MTKLKFIYAQVNIYAINLHLIAFRGARRDMPCTHTHTRTQNIGQNQNQIKFSRKQEGKRLAKTCRRWDTLAALDLTMEKQKIDSQTWLVPLMVSKSLLSILYRKWIRKCIYPLQRVLNMSQNAVQMPIACSSDSFSQPELTWVTSGKQFVRRIEI